MFKRNTAVTFDNTQRGMQNEWKAQKGVNFFMGYLCGKGAINLPEYAKRNPGRSVVPQHVVRSGRIYKLTLTYRMNSQKQSNGI